MTDDDIETNASESAEETLRIYLQRLNQKADTQTSYIQGLRGTIDAQSVSPWAALTALGLVLGSSLIALGLGHESLAHVLAGGALGILAQPPTRKKA